MKSLLTSGVAVILCLIFSSLSLAGQEADHVYLKNGSLIRGHIVEIEPSKHLKIRDFSGNIWSYPLGEVEKVTSEPYTLTPEEGGKQGFENGFANMTSIGFLVGSPGNQQVAPFSLLMVNGYRSPFGLFAGAGIGIEFLGTSFLPIFVDLRYDLTGRDVVPYIQSKAGYSFPMTPDFEEYDMETSYSGGMLAGAGIGLKIRTRNHFAWDVELMYRFQRTRYSEYYSWNEQEYNYTDIYNRIEIRIGFYID